MARFYGKVGYAVMVETAPGVEREKIVPRMYYGDDIKNVSRWENGQGLNDDINISNEISILADPYAYENFHMIRYVEYMGTKWKVRNVTVQRPRLLLSLGGVYNDQLVSEETTSFEC